MEIIDTTTIDYLKSLAGDTDFFTTLVDTFLRDTALETAQLMEAYEQKDAFTLLHTAHKYKSSSRNLGANILMNLCLEVENLAKEGKGTFPETGVKVKQIVIEAKRAVEVLEKIKNQ